MSAEKLTCLPNPCTSCPYRKDTPPGIWAREEYDKLPAWDSQWNMAGIFLCHQRRGKAVCRGWLEVHNDNIGVRLAMCAKIEMTHREPTRFPLYRSGAEARKAASAAIAKIPLVLARWIAKSWKPLPAITAHLIARHYE